MLKVYNMQPNEFSLVLLVRRIKIEELRDSKVVPEMSHKFDLLNTSVRVWPGLW